MFVTVLKTGGEYTESHVEWLQRQVQETVYCLTDSNQAMAGVVRIPLLLNLPGWWSKMEMFSMTSAPDFLYADLDTVFLNGIPPEFKELQETHVLDDMYGGDHINSGLMYLTAPDRAPVWKDFSR